MRLHPTLALLLVGLAGCGSCGGCGSGALTVEGPHPYVRCAAQDPPADREARAGEVAFALAGGVLTVAPPAGEVEVALVRGGAPYPGPGAELARLVGEPAPHLVIVLGDLGDDEVSATAALSAFGALGPLVVVLPGGRDEAAVLDEAFDALEGEAAERVVDARGLRRIAIGSADWVIAPGAPAGRYARTEGACGLGVEDTEALAEAVGEDGERVRWLVSWAAPAAPALGSVEAGDPGLAALVAAVGARGGFFAWPRESVGVVAQDDGGGLWVGVPPGWGWPVEARDASRVAPSVLRVVQATDGSVALRAGAP